MIAGKNEIIVNFLFFALFVFLLLFKNLLLTDILLSFSLIIPCRNSLSNFHFLSYLYVKQVFRNPIHLRHCPGTRHADVHAAAPLSHLSLESPE